ncbi:hypothetical protein ACTFIR_006841 [Dictyostelium discoideum]
MDEHNNSTIIISNNVSQDRVETSQERRSSRRRVILNSNNNEIFSHQEDLSTQQGEYILDSSFRNRDNNNNSNSNTTTLSLLIQRSGGVNGIYVDATMDENSDDEKEELSEGDQLINFEDVSYNEEVLEDDHQIQLQLQLHDGGGGGEEPEYEEFFMEYDEEQEEQQQEQEEEEQQEGDDNQYDAEFSIEVDVELNNFNDQYDEGAMENGERRNRLIIIHNHIHEVSDDDDDDDDNNNNNEGDQVIEYYQGGEEEEEEEEEEGDSNGEGEGEEYQPHEGESEEGYEEDFYIEHDDYDHDIEIHEEEQEDVDEELQEEGEGEEEEEEVEEEEAHEEQEENTNEEEEEEEFEDIDESNQHVDSNIEVDDEDAHVNIDGDDDDDDDIPTVNNSRNEDSYWTYGDLSSEDNGVSTSRRRLFRRGVSLHPSIGYDVELSEILRYRDQQELYENSNNNGGGGGSSRRSRGSNSNSSSSSSSRYARDPELQYVYEHPVSEQFGYIGWFLYNNFQKSGLLRVDSGPKFLSQVLNFYLTLLEQQKTYTFENQMKLEAFISCFLNIAETNKLLGIRLSTKELIPIKFTLDIIEHHFKSNDSPLFKHYIEHVLPVSELFYSKITNDKLAIINKRLVSALSSAENYSSVINIHDKRSQYFEYFRKQLWSIRNQNDLNTLSSYYK